jgi:hypothetical protein
MGSHLELDIEFPNHTSSITKRNGIQAAKNDGRWRNAIGYLIGGELLEQPMVVVYPLVN